MTPARDHGGGLDDAIARYGGQRSGWLDLSTGINPNPYPVGPIDPGAWSVLPDTAAHQALIAAARSFWSVPDGADKIAAPGASALIARLPALWPIGRVRIDAPTYNEYQAAFQAHGWHVTDQHPDVRVVVHPNNPTGAFWDGSEPAPMTIIDESFCDVAPKRSCVGRGKHEAIVLKSFGKFWGLAGLRLGFAIGPKPQIAQLRELLGPWPVSGPALHIGARALRDRTWAEETRAKLQASADKLDSLMQRAGAEVIGGTSLFRLYRVDRADAWQDRLARAQIWSRIFPYSETWLRLGLPPDHGWSQLEAAL